MTPEILRVEAWRLKGLTGLEREKVLDLHRAIAIERSFTSETTRRYAAWVCFELERLLDENDDSEPSPCRDVQYLYRAEDQNPADRGYFIGQYIESDRRRWPELKKALDHCNRENATLITPQFKFLERNVRFLHALMQARVGFQACGVGRQLYGFIQPALWTYNAPQLTVTSATIDIIAQLAEVEAASHAERTRAGLAAARARGTLLGSHRPGHWTGREDRRRLGAMKANMAARLAISQKARKYDSVAGPIIVALRAQGASLSSIAWEMTLGHIGGKFWNATAVWRLLNRVSPCALG